MNLDRFLPQIWINDEITPLDKKVFLSYKFELNDPFSFSSQTICYATTPLFAKEWVCFLQQQLIACSMEFPLLSKNEGEGLLEAIRKLHIRTIAYRWVKCHVGFKQNSPKEKILCNIILEPLDVAFSKEQSIWQLCIPVQYPKIQAGAFTFPSIDFAYKQFVYREVLTRGCHDGIITGNRQQVIETCLGQLFVVKGNSVITPASECGLSFVAGRDWVLEQLSNSGFQVEESLHLSLARLYSADELFVLSSDGIYAVKGLDTARYYDQLRIKLLDRINEQIKPT